MAGVGFIGSVDCELDEPLTLEAVAEAVGVLDPVDRIDGLNRELSAMRRRPGDE